MKFDTKVVRSSSKPDKTTGAVVPPIYQTATYVLEEVGKDKGFDYTRASNPTRQLLEEHLAAIEGAKYGVCFSSGMSAVDACLKLLKSGDHVVCSDDVYGGVSRQFNTVLVNYGLEFTYVNSSNPEEVKTAVKKNTKLLWIETPTNPLLKVTDLHAMNKIAKLELEDKSLINQFANLTGNPSDFAFAHIEFYRDYIEKITNNKLPTIDGKEAMKSLKIVHAIYKSHLENREVFLNEPELQSQLGL